MRKLIEKRTSVPICQARGKLSLVAPAGETIVRSLFARFARARARQPTLAADTHTHTYAQTRARAKRRCAYNDNYQSISFNSQAI